MTYTIRAILCAMAISACDSPSLIDAMKAKIDTEAGKRIYARRLAIVELWVEPVETRCLRTSASTNA